MIMFQAIDRALDQMLAWQDREYGLEEAAPSAQSRAQKETKKEPVYDEFINAGFFRYVEASKKAGPISITGISPTPRTSTTQPAQAREPESIEAEWRRDLSLHDEFGGSIEAFRAYRRADRQGLIHNRAQTRTGVPEEFLRAIATEARAQQYWEDNPVLQGEFSTAAIMWSYILNARRGGVRLTKGARL